MKQEKIWEVFQNDESLVASACPGGGRHAFLAKRIPPGRTVLNVGVGSGAFEALLVEQGVDVSCLDPSGASIEKLRHRLELGSKARVGYAQSIPFDDGSFDRVIMSEVLEHLDDDTLEQALQEVLRVLRADGVFMGTVPADERLEEGVVVCPKCGDRFHRWGHVQSFSRQRLHAVLRRRFARVTVRRVALGDLQRLNWKGKVAWAFKALQAAVGRSGSNQNLYFEASNA